MKKDYKFAWLFDPSKMRQKIAEIKKAKAAGLDNGLYDSYG